MKNSIFYASLLLIFSSFSNSQSVLNYQSGTIIEVQTGASIITDSVIIDGIFTGGGTISGFLYTLNLKILIQGFYNAGMDLKIQDTVTAYLKNSSPPYSAVDSAKAYLSSIGEGTFSFLNAVNGVSYFIQTKHRNSIETWSNSVQMFENGSLNYDFTTAENQAFGDNMIQVDTTPVRFAIYSGDINQDGSVDAADMAWGDNDASNFESGYVPSDINGDGFVDASDLVIIDNNAANYITAIRP